ncbi:tubulin polyglutamylase ttll6-like [Hypomesus transpacificus]|uniref:tubulin polyglutamylase ttll6-like n=1 Tax=Hypomesus transpacificus TaxID=137520 RepID=UPI001F080A72|nr:tubulin polyglutamylase ttll6-like [Hypomesus transpacificus]
MEDWVIYWIDCSVSLDRIMDIKRYQKINHFPGMNEICRKDLLARNMNKMLRLFPKEYHIFPKTWCLPADYVDFQGYCRMWKHKTFICKPDNSCQGKGIYITRQPRDIDPEEHIICQSYISKPFVIDGFKFDLRLYVLVTSCDPLRIFLYNEGLMRFATSKYKPPHSNNLEDICMHLTNYAINKHNNNFDRDVESGSKRKLSSFRSWLSQHTYDPMVVWSDMEEVIIKTLITAQPTLKQNYRIGFSSQVGPSSCFEILGFDILLDFKLKPWLLEVNHSPSFATDSSLDWEVKEGLLTDALTLLNLGAIDRRRVLEEDKRMVKERLLQKHQPCPKTRREQLLSSQASWMAELEKYEQDHCGGFLRIYPRDDSPKYDRFLQQSGLLYQENVASKAREECSRKMLREMQMKEELAGRTRLPGKRWSRGEARGLQGESQGDRSSSQIAEKTDVALKDPAGSEMEESRLPGQIVEEEEVERLKSLELREILLRKLGVVDFIYSLLIPPPGPKKVFFPPCHRLEYRSRKQFHPVLRVMGKPSAAKAGHLQPLLRSPCWSKDHKSRQLSMRVIKLGLPAQIEQGFCKRLSGFTENWRDPGFLTGERGEHSDSTEDKQGNCLTTSRPAAPLWRVGQLSTRSTPSIEETSLPPLTPGQAKWVRGLRK